MFVTAQKSFVNQNESANDQLVKINEKLAQYESYMEQLKKNIPHSLNSKLIHINNNIQNIKSTSRQPNKAQISDGDKNSNFNDFSLSLKEKIHNMILKSLSTTDNLISSSNVNISNGEESISHFSMLRNQLNESVQTSKAKVNDVERQIAAIIPEQNSFLQSNPYLSQIHHDMLKQTEQLNQIKQILDNLPSRVSQQKIYLNQESSFDLSSSNNNSQYDLAKIYEVPDCTKQFLILKARTIETIDKFTGELNSITVRTSALENESESASKTLSKFLSKQELIDKTLYDIEDTAMDSMDKIDSIENTLGSMEVISKLTQIKENARKQFYEIKTELKELRSEVQVKENTVNEPIIE